MLHFCVVFRSRTSRLSNQCVGVDARFGYVWLFFRRIRFRNCVERGFVIWSWVLRWIEDVSVPSNWAEMCPLGIVQKWIELIDFRIDWDIVKLYENLFTFFRSTQLLLFSSRISVLVVVIVASLIRIGISPEVIWLSYYVVYETNKRT